jgi:heme A synthase
MSIITLLITLILVAAALWLINKRIPMDRNIKIILNVGIVIFLILWVQVAFGVIEPISDVNIGSIHMR